MAYLAPLVVLMGYLLGSISSAYFIAKWVKGVDIRQVGDRNPGAGNTFRQIGPLAGVAVAVADIAKGAAPVVVAEFAGFHWSVVLLTGLAAIAGHNWPLYFGFKGGVGTATALGVALALLPREVMLLGIVFLGPFLLTRNLVLIASTGAVVLPFVSWAFHEPWHLVFGPLAVAALVGGTLASRILRKKG